MSNTYYVLNRSQLVRDSPSSLSSANCETFVVPDEELLPVHLARFAVRHGPSAAAVAGSLVVESSGYRRFDEGDNRYTVAVDNRVVVGEDSVAEGEHCVDS